MHWINTELANEGFPTEFSGSELDEHGDKLHVAAYQHLSLAISEHLANGGILGEFATPRQRRWLTTGGSHIQVPRYSRPSS